MQNAHWGILQFFDLHLATTVFQTFVIPPANFVCGGVYCFHVVCPCVRAYVRQSVRNVLFS